ncbi:MAG: hypothetical protein Q8P67_21450 [archaeon]|nr:hypothetical protein [archaeon]
MDSWPGRPLSDYYMETAVIATTRGDWTPSPEEVIGVVCAIKSGFSGERNGVDLAKVPFEGSTVGEILQREPHTAIRFGALCIVDSRWQKKKVALALSTLLPAVLLAAEPLLTPDDLFVSTVHDGSRRLALELGSACTGIKFRKPETPHIESEVVIARVSTLTKASMQMIAELRHKFWLAPPLDRQLLRVSRFGAPSSSPAPLPRLVCRL